MPRSIWRGVMSFGMVAIPVRLYLATESTSKVSFNLLCPEHKSRIKNKRWCVEGDHEVAWGDVVRGYEYEKGSYVELDDADLEKLPLRSSKAIDISGFIKEGEKREVIEAPEPEAETTVVDLMSALKASVEKAKKGEAKTKRSAASSRSARRKAS